MIRVVTDRKAAVRSGWGGGLNRSVHYWVRVRKARRLDGEHIWYCVQCRTVVAKLKGLRDDGRQPERWELEDAGVNHQCDLQLAASVLTA